MTSKRCSTIEASITMAISAKAKTLKKQGLDVLSFSAGEPDFHTPQNIKEAGIKAITDGKTTYTPASGIIELKEAICKKLKKDNNLNYSSSEIIVSSGAKHSLYNVMMALIDPGDEVIIPCPYWVSYPCQVQLAEGKSVYIKTDDKSDFKITPEQLKNSITPKTKAIILSTPSNPTGSIYNKQELESIAEILTKNNVYAISDEIYEKLIYGNSKHISIASLSKKMKDLTILVNGVSKAYAMTGWRIGYTASNQELATAMNKLQSHSTSNPATPSQWAALEALNGDQSYVEKMRVAFDERRKFIVEELNKINGITCIEPQGAFYAFPNISALFGKKCKSGIIKSSLDFCNYLLEEKYLACVPGAGFGLDDYIRLSYATSLEDIKRGITRINEWVCNLC